MASTTGSTTRSITNSTTRSTVSLAGADHQQGMG
jgi:hypothetical protein